MITQESTAKHLSTAMEGLAKIAKYYKRHGSLPTFTAIDGPIAKRKLHKPVSQPSITCPECGLMFIGQLSVRCQCKVQMRRKAEVA